MSVDPLDLIFQEHERQEDMCQVLEQIADSLPHGFDRDVVSKVVSYLECDLVLHIRDEEDGLFPLLEIRGFPEDNLDEILAQLALEHATDECFAYELVESLEVLARGERPKEPNTLGYMLRACFESHRRHLAWENTVVLPLARKRLTPADLQHLTHVMLTHRNELR